MPKQSSAIEKALLVIEEMTAARRPVPLAALADSTGLPKQTVHRILQQLEETKMVRRGFRADHFVAGARLRKLALSALQAAMTTLPVHAVLESLVADVGESANIGVLSGFSVVYLDRVEYAWPLRLQISPNDRLPAHCVAIGKLLLAFLPDRLRLDLLRSARLERFTDSTVTEPALLERELAAIRRQDYALNNQEFHPGLLGAAVPIRRQDGEVVAALAIHGVAPRVTPDGLRAQLPRMREAAERLGELLTADAAAALAPGESRVAAAKA